MKTIDMAGYRSGRLTVSRQAGKNHDGRIMWFCHCDCGQSCVVAGKYLRNGRTRSCGCLRNESIGQVKKSHGMSGSSTYMSWASMLSRCYNQDQGSYQKYGALGVTVCDRWRESFENFFTDMGFRPDGMTLDRKDPFGNYELRNCKWSTRKEQSLNQRGHAAIRLLREITEAEKNLTETFGIRPDDGRTT